MTKYNIQIYSVKNSFEKYPLTAGCESISLSDIEKSITLLMQGHIPYEFRTTVCAELHTVEDIVAIANRINGSARYFLQNFVDSGDILSTGMHPVEEKRLKEMACQAQNIVPATKIR